MQQYNYVIFQTPSVYYRISYSDLKKRKDVIYIDQFKPNNSRILNFIYRTHHSKKVNSVLKLPAKNIWYSNYFKNTFTNFLPLCFIFNARWMQYSYLQEYILYLKKQYNNSKFICFYQDLINSHAGAEPDKILNLFDLVLSYDKGDAEKFGLTYHPTVYSNYIVDNDNNIPESDVYFIGLAKDRLELILDVFYHLKEEGMSCDFYLSGVPSNNQIEEQGLNFIDSMNYTENLKHVVRTKCILEIVQGKAKGSTVRTWEAIMYDKKLLTNNLSIVDDYYYNSNYVSLLNKKNIDIRFLKQNNSYINPYKNQISPNKLLDFITQRL
jgi:hypothetical protein